MSKSNNQSKLEVQNISASTKAGKKLISDAGFTLEPGEIVGLIGPNGAGKTSLMRTVCGLLEADSGTVTIDGEDLADIEMQERAKKIAYLPQGNQIHWPMQVQKLISLGRIPHLSSLRHLKDTDEAIIESAMELTQTRHLAERTATSLSGGERALTLLARAVVVGATYLFADEPTASLDPYHQLHVMELLKSLSQTGQGVLVTLHDLHLAMSFCDRLLLVNNGQLVADGTPEEVLSDKRLREVFGIKVARWNDGNSSFIMPVSR